MFKSIRSRLAVSYAAIALVAAVVLGAVLLAILQNFYSSLEFDYLRGNARVIAELVGGKSASNRPPEEVQSLIENLAFLSQTRIQVYNPQGEQLYDSGSPQNIDVKLGDMKKVLVQTNGPIPSGPLPEDVPIISVFVTGKSGTSMTAPVPQEKGRDVYYSFQTGGSPFGFALGSGVPAMKADVGRSKLSITARVQDPTNGQVVGNVKLSEGPAYGRDVLRSVAWGWVLASAIAVILAAVLGRFLSRRISAPILSLTDATARMARGDLTSRAEVRSQDEFGQLASSFNEMADQVETTVSSLRRFVSDAAHELRTPLTALRTNLDLALDDRDTAGRVVFIERAKAMASRLEELNANLLDLSRLEAKGHDSSRVLLDLTSLLRSRIELYASEAEQAGLLFEAKIPLSPIHVQADASQLTRAMDNLVDNACKFTGPGGSVHLALSEQEGRAIFVVTDTGIGIPEDDLPQLFNRFHRGRNSTAYQGSGLGLAIVKAVVDAHGGSVKANSGGEGRGGEFSFELPAVVAGNPS